MNHINHTRSWWEISVDKLSYTIYFDVHKLVGITNYHEKCIYLTWVVVGVCL